MTALNSALAVVFLVAAVWTWTQRREAGPGAGISVTLAATGAGLLLRLPAIEGLLAGLPSGPDPVKHGLGVLGLVALAGFLLPRTTTTAVGKVVYPLVGAGAPLSLIAIASVTGPWSPETDLLVQSARDPWMIPYWLIYFGICLTGLTLLAVMGLRAVLAGLPSKPHFSVVCFTAAGAFSCLWAVTGPLAWGLLAADRQAIAAAVAHIAKILLLLAGTVFIIGILSPAIWGAATTVTRRQNITALHTFLRHACPSIAAPSRGVIARVRRPVEIADALAFLQHYAQGDEPTRPAEMATAIRAAAQRHASLQAPTDGQEWAAWVREDRLADIGAYFR